MGGIVIQAQKRDLVNKIWTQQPEWLNYEETRRAFPHPPSLQMRKSSPTKCTDLLKVTQEPPQSPSCPCLTPIQTSHLLWRRLRRATEYLLSAGTSEVRELEIFGRFCHLATPVFLGMAPNKPFSPHTPCTLGSHGGQGDIDTKGMQSQ